jgi:hypothetical protein
VDNSRKRKGKGNLCAEREQRAKKNRNKMYDKTLPDHKTLRVCSARMFV